MSGVINKIGDKEITLHQDKDEDKDKTKPQEETNWKTLALLVGSRAGL